MKSKHFTIGTKVKIAHRPPAEVIAVVTCKCRLAHTALRIKFDDGSTELVLPIALNQGKGAHHGNF